MMETELDRLSGTRLQLEMQVNTLESAIFNQETMAAMKQGADVLKNVHGNLCVILRYSAIKCNALFITLHFRLHQDSG